MNKQRLLPAFSQFIFAGCVAAAALLSAGCNRSDRPQLVLVSGQVLIDGEPLAYGYVRFVPENARPSGGQLNSFGRFRLSCFGENDGAVVGRHKVAVVSCEPLSEDEIAWNAPQKYAECVTSGLEQVIDGATDSIVIHLTWDGDQPFRVREPSGD